MGVWTTRQDALTTWVQSASGLPMIWGQQNGGVLPQPYCLGLFGTNVPIGAKASITQNYDALRSPGQEIQVVAKRKRLLTVSIQVFTSSVLDDDSAPAVLQNVVGKLELPNQLRALAAAGLFLQEAQAVRNLSDLRKVAFISRAQVDVFFRLQDTQATYETYIKHVKGLMTFGTSAPVAWQADGT